MPVDARPFLQLTTESGSTVKCGRPELIPLSLGLARGQQGGAVTDNPTHKVTVYVVFGAAPADLVDGATVRINVVPGEWQSFTVLRNGIQKDAGTWTVYLRATRDTVRP